jgi:3-oxoacyl-[acyl-carrier-protein] synthase II
MSFSRHPCSSSTGLSRRRVVITGLGVISPLGNSPEKIWQHLCTGQSGVRPLKYLPPIEGLVRYGAQADEFTGSIDDFGPMPKERKKAIRKGLKVMCRETMMAVAAAQHAAVDSGYGDTPMDPERSGVVFGSDYMLSPPQDFQSGMIRCGVVENDFQFSRWGTAGLGEMNPLWMLKFLPNMPASHIAIFNDLRGPNNSLTLREIAGLMAIREAAQTIQRNHADCMIAGATGTRIHPFKTIHAIQTEQLADPQMEPARASRPFDQDRTGMVLGEGAGALILEELESARSRGATIYAEVAGTGCCTVTSANLKAQRTDAIGGAIRQTLADSGRSPSEVGHISAHGLGTVECDREEAEAIAHVFGEQAGQIPVTATKSFFGNLGAGSGVVELIASLLSLGTGHLHGTLNYETADPGCPLAISRPVAATAGDYWPAGHSFVKANVTPQGQAAALLVALLE